MRRHMGQYLVMELNLPKFATLLASTKLYVSTPYYPYIPEDPLPKPGPNDPHIYAWYRGGGRRISVPWVVTPAEIMRTMGLYPEWMSGNTGLEIDLAKLAEILANIVVYAGLGSSYRKPDESEAQPTFVHPRLTASPPLSEIEYENVFRDDISTPHQASLARLLVGMGIYPKWLPCRVPEPPYRIQEELRLDFESNESIELLERRWIPDELRTPRWSQGARIFFPIREWQTVHNAGCGWLAPVSPRR